MKILETPSVDHARVEFMVKGGIKEVSINGRTARILFQSPRIAKDFKENFGIKVLQTGVEVVPFDKVEKFISKKVSSSQESVVYLDLRKEFKKGEEVEIHYVVPFTDAGRFVRYIAN
jgi:hypothetical protein